MWVSTTYELFLNYTYTLLDLYILAGALTAQTIYLPWKTLGHIRKKKEKAVDITVAL